MPSLWHVLDLNGESCPAALSNVSEETMKATTMNTETNAVHYFTCQSNKDQYHIPAVSTPLGLHVMEDGFLAAPEAGVSVETWKQQHVQTYTRKNWWSAVFVIHTHDNMQCKTNTCCSELLTSSVTGTEPDQVLLCQGAAELSRIQGAGHQLTSTINYRSMSYDSFKSAMLTAKKSISRNTVIIM